MVGRPRKLDAGEHARVLALRDREGRTLREIAALYGVGIATVSRVYAQAKRQQDAGASADGPQSAAAPPADAPRRARRTPAAAPRPDERGGAQAGGAAEGRADGQAGEGPRRPVLSLASRPESGEPAPSGDAEAPDAGDPGRQLEAEVAEALTAYRRWQATPDETRYGEVDASLARVRRALAAIEIELWTAT